MIGIFLIKIEVFSKASRGGVTEFLSQACVVEDSGPLSFTKTSDVKEFLSQLAAEARTHQKSFQFLGGAGAVDESARCDF